MEELNINQLDIEKYINWLYAQKKFNLKEELDKEKNLLDHALYDIAMNEKLSMEEKEAAKHAEIKRYNIIADDMCSMTIWEPPTENEKRGICYFMDATLRMKKDALNRDLCSRGVHENLIIGEHLDRALNEICSEEYKGLLSCIIGGWVIDDFYKFAQLVGIIRFAKYADSLVNKDSGELAKDIKIESSYIDRVRELEKYGFFNLEKVKDLSIKKQSKIVAYIMDGNDEYTRKAIRIVLGLQQ